MPMAKKKHASELGSFKIQHSSDVPFEHTCSDIKDILTDIQENRDGRFGVLAAICIWEVYPQIVLRIKREDEEIRKNTGTDRPIDMLGPSGRKIGKVLGPYEGIIEWCDARRDLDSAHTAATDLLMRAASERRIDEKPIAVSSQLCRRIFRSGFPTDLNDQDAFWPRCVDALNDLSESERETVFHAQVQIERIRGEVVSPSVNPRPDLKKKPDWDGTTLSYDGITLKTFKRHPAANQRMLLDAFQAAGWPATIQNPWHNPKLTSSVPLRTLNETLRAINDTMTSSIRFEAMGNGQCRWVKL
jgi:hypothetical protein